MSKSLGEASFGAAVGRFANAISDAQTCACPSSPDRVGLSSCRLAPSGHLLAVLLIPEALVPAVDALGSMVTLPGWALPACLSWPDRLQPRRARLINVPPSLALANVTRLLEHGDDWQVLEAVHPVERLSGLARCDTVEVVLLPKGKGLVLPGGFSFTSTDGRSVTLPLHPLSDLPPLPPSSPPPPAASPAAPPLRPAPACLAPAGQPLPLASQPPSSGSVPSHSAAAPSPSPLPPQQQPQQPAGRASAAAPPPTYAAAVQRAAPNSPTSSLPDSPSQVPVAMAAAAPMHSPEALAGRKHLRSPSPSPSRSSSPSRLRAPAPAGACQ
jgi:hypothetical protein